MKVVTSKYLNNIKLVNFLPLATANFLKKGEKEKTFVKVSKVLRRIKKTNLLNDFFFVQKRFFFNKVIFSIKNKKLISESNLNLLLNNSDIQFLKNKIKSRYDNDSLVKNRISFFLNNFYFSDFSEFYRQTTFFKKSLDNQKTLELKKRKFINLKFIIRKNSCRYFFRLYKYDRCTNINFYRKNYSLKIIEDDNFGTNNSIFKIEKIWLFFQNLSVLNRLLSFYYKINNVISQKINKFDFPIKKNIIVFNDFVIFKSFYIKKLKNDKIIKLFIGIKKKKKILKKKKAVTKKKYYYLSKKILDLQKKYKQLNKKYLYFKKKGKRISRFEFKKRKMLYTKLMRGYRQSRKFFFKFKKRRKYLNKKQMLRIKKLNSKKKEKDKKSKLFNYLGFKYLIIKKSVKKINKRLLRLNFYKYNIFPILFSPIKFFNICLSYYRLYFTFKEQKVWGKQQKIPTILNIKRDIRITVRNFKKNLKDEKFVSNDFLNNLYDNILLAGSKSGFLLKFKKQAYVFMIKNAIFLQFLMKRRRLSKRKRRKKVDRK